MKATRRGRPTHGNTAKVRVQIMLDPDLLTYAKSTGNVSRCIEDALRRTITSAHNPPGP